MDSSSTRIDWFDGSVVESRPAPAPARAPAPAPAPPPARVNKLLGFRRLQELARAEPAGAVLALSGRTSFWDLLDSELKPDFVVLVARVLAKIPGGGGAALARALLEKALRSRFLNSLAEYLACLPDTRISEKKTNMQFWEEPRTFYTSVLAFCRSVCAELPERARDAVAPLLDLVRSSVDGVMSEHRETLSDVVFQMIADLQMDLEKISYNDGISSNNIDAHLQKVPTEHREFRSMSIFPLHEDLTRERQCTIEGNLINGAYANVEHYLDVQFKLMREDYIAPLRNGILKYLQDPSKHRHENIRVHPEVFFLRTHVTNNKVGYLLDFASKYFRSGTNYNSSSSDKHLMFGSLVLFTCDNFGTIVCGTVLDTDSALMRDGFIVVSLHDAPPSRLFSTKFLMIESEVFFEPYHRVLKVLQEFEIQDFPMKEYIVAVQPIIKHPTYLTKDSQYNLVEGSEELFIPILQDECWPSKEELTLDESQYEAYKLALTREFAVIQGPPGTGKTYIGVRVAKTILSNLALSGSPMLVICYTNHALDQFLEKILNITTDVVRLGSQSKSKKLEPYSLNNVRARGQSKHSYVYNSKRKEQENIMKRMTDIQDSIAKCEKEILAYKAVKPFLKIGNKTYHLENNTTEDPMSAWLFAHLKDTSPLLPMGGNHSDTFDSWDDDKIVLESCFSVAWALKEIESMQTSIKYVNDITTDSNEAKKIIDNFQSRIQNLQKKINYFECYFYRHQNDHRRHIPMKAVKNLDMLSVQERWALYFFAVMKIKEELVADMVKLENDHRQCALQLEEVRLLVDIESVRSARVLGATTTAAARAHALIGALKSHIVIVEEAAEVLEAHIVASLTQHCQHLILIGDHQQLRPTASDYQLARKYNLEVSLFERMISNGVHSRTLTTQHRMSPQILRLIAPAVYPELKSHESVLNLPDVRGLKSRLWFLEHRELEDNIGEEGWSHRSRHEARWSIALAEHLRRQDYKSDDIVLLTTYTAQADLIRQMSEECPLLKDIQVTVVDNYQGYENRIVILSLVRSNREGNIGYLALSNRVCVALSRAREGLYMIGNLNLLKQRSALWQRVGDVLEEERAVGDVIVLRCPCHPDVYTTVSSPDEWAEKSPLGGCRERCGAALACGHCCTAHCHGYDRQHHTFICDAPCPRSCANGHACPLICGEPCGRCSVRLVRTLPCGHDKELPCFAHDDSPTCLAIVTATLPECGHQIEKNCYLELKKVKCRVCALSRKTRVKAR